MTQHWQELLPIDRYVVTANGLLHDYDRKVLTFLYQPLIGASCFSLYMTLWAELEENRLWSESHSHHSLMNFMDMNLQAIYNSRIKLEGIGLLKTYVKEDEDLRSFVYELQPPLTPEQFLLDGMLNIYLYRKIGKAQFARVKRFFSDQNMQDSDYKQVTKMFQDVFTSCHPSAFSYSDEMKQDIEMEQDCSYMGRQHPKNIKAEASNFDFDLLFAGLHENLISSNAFTEPVREVISTLAFLYGIDPIQMKNIVISAINEDNTINLEELRKSARDWYQFEHFDQLPSLAERTQPAIYHTMKQEPETKEEKLIRYYETTSPLKVLKDKSGGRVPAKADVKIIEDVMFGQKLTPGVMNVLIDIVLQLQNNKFPRNYVEKIASEWARKGLKTVTEAMESAKAEHDRYTSSAKGEKNKTGKKNPYKKQPIRTEVLPSWFKEEEKEDKATKNIPSTEKEIDLEQKKREVQEKLKRLRS